jgi:hypothetical protein
MFSSKIRHWVVALGLATVAGVAASSAAGLGSHAQRVPAAKIEREAMPVASGDLGEIVIYAPGDLGEIVVHAPHDLGDVLVMVPRLPAPGVYLAKIVVTAPRDSGAMLARDAQEAPALAQVR